MIRHAHNLPSARAFAALLSLLALAPARAVPVTDAQAAAAAASFVAAGGAMGVELKGGVSDVRAVTATNGAAPFRVVTFADGGFIVTSGDTEDEPFVFISDGPGDLVEDDGNPLWGVLRHDMSANAAARSARATSGGGAQLLSTPPAENKWAKWLPRANGGAQLLDAQVPDNQVADICVPRIMDVRWDQRGSGSIPYYYNDAIPHHAYVGCVALALGQIVRHYQWPSTIGRVTRTCRVWNGEHGDASAIERVDLTTSGATYNWASMPAAPDSYSNPPGQDEVSRFLFDAGITVGTQWGAPDNDTGADGGSGTSTYIAAANALSTIWGYADTVWCFHDASVPEAGIYPTGETHDQVFKRIKDIYLPNLAAGMPVLTSINGHVVVTDGYGYSNDNLYFHINYGWGGVNSANSVTRNTGWYVATRPIQGHETGLWGAGYNISTNRVGALFSGRVYDTNGSPLGNFPVVALGADGVRHHTVANSAGIYVFNLEPGRYVVYATNNVAGAYNEVATCRSVNSANDRRYGTVGNVSEVDLRLSPGSIPFWTNSPTEDYCWNGSKTSWNDPGAWRDLSGGSVSDKTWVDMNNAFFTTAGNAVLAADVLASHVNFLANATVGGEGVLSAFEVSVDTGVAATIAAPLSSGTVKSGAGTLVLTRSRAGKGTILSEGTLRLAGGVDIGSLVFGTDPSKNVVLDYDGNALATPVLSDFLYTGMDETLTNGVFGTGTDALSFTEANLPSVLTIAKDAVVSNSQFTVNISDGSTHTINIASGKMINTRNGNHWLMQNSASGRLNINVTNGGVLEFAGEAHALTCRDNGNYNDPSLHLALNGSTLRVKNNRSFRFGTDDENDNPVAPVGVLAATNSVIEAYGVFIGNGTIGANTAGSYTADLDGCTVSVRQFRVFHDRPQNAIRLNNTRLVLTAADDNWLTAEDEFVSVWGVNPISVGEGGLVMDSNGRNGSLRANLQGPGTITKTGTGKLTVTRNQTGTGPLVCQTGELSINAGLSVARPLTVKSGAKLSVNGSSLVSFGGLALESGAILNINDSAMNVTPMSVDALTLPASGTVTLTAANGAFSAGVWTILRKSGIAVSQVESKLVPQVPSGNAYWFDVEGDDLKLIVHEPLTWTGAAGDGKMSTGGNWSGGTAPVSGDRVAFNSAATVVADLGADVRLGGLVLGAIVTFTGNLTTLAINDTSKVAVGTNSTVTLVGDLEFSGGGNKYVANHIAANGEFVVTGVIRALPTYSGTEIHAVANMSDGFVVAKVLESNTTNSESFPFRLTTRSGGWTNRWAIGSSGISGPKGFWLFRIGSNPQAIIRADADFTISTTIGDRNTLTFNTTGKDGLPHTVTIGDGTSGGLIRDGVVNIVGTGTVVANYDWSVHTFGASDCTLAFNVKDAAAFRLSPGANVGNGTVSVSPGAMLEIGAGACAKNVTVNPGATLALPDAATASARVTGTLALGDGAKVVLGSLSTNVVAIQTGTFNNSGATAVSLSTNAAPPATGRYTLIDVSTLKSPDEPSSTFSFDTSSLPGHTATISYNSFVQLEKVFLDIVAPAVSWPATWNNGAPANAAMQNAFAAWKAAYGVTTFDDAAESAFLLGIAPTQQVAELEIQSIALNDGHVTLTANTPLNSVNGVVYMKYGPAPGALTGVKAVTVDAATGAATFPHAASAEFYTLCVGYAIPLRRTIMTAPSATPYSAAPSGN